MPPKKNVNSAQTENKVHIRRKRRPPKVKPPTMIRISIPNPQRFYSFDTPEPELPQWNERHIGLQAKINLANQVAQAALVKSDALELEFPVDLPPKKKKMTKKVVSTFFQNDAEVDPLGDVPDLMPEPVIEVPVKTPRKKKAATKAAPKEHPDPLAELTTPAKTPKKKKTAAKVELKEDPGCLPDLSDAVTSSDAKTPKKRKIATKTELKEHPVSEPAPEEHCFLQPTVTPKVAKKSTKPVLKRAAKAKPESRKRAASTETKPTKKRKLTPKTDRPAVKKRPSPSDEVPVTRVLRNKTIQGKEAVKNAPAGITSPSILETFKTPETEHTTPENPNTTLETNNQLKPKPISSRITSLNSNSSFSWAKDISSSSETTCITVTNNDIVHIDNKIPIVKLKHIDSEINKQKDNTVNELSSSDSDSSDSDLSESEELNPVGIDTLNLSVSSISNTAVDNYKKTAQKLDATLKEMDLEIINWISCKNEDVSADLKKLKDKVFDILDSEFKLITHCRQLKQLVSPKPTKDVTVEDKCLPVVNTEEAVSFKPNTLTVPQNKVEIENKPVEKEDKIIEDVKEINDISYDKSKYVHYDDDDDALSLFAESITGFDTPRMNSSVLSTSTKIIEGNLPEPKSKIQENHTYCPHISIEYTSKSRIPECNSYCPRNTEEYVPPTKSRIPESNSYCPRNTDEHVPLFRPKTPVNQTYRPHIEEYVPEPKSKIPERHTYCPSKIDENHIKTRTVEKQNADSTSLPKDIDKGDEPYEDSAQKLTDEIVGPKSPVTRKTASLLAGQHQRVPFVKSVVFRGVCFFNMLNYCKTGPACTFPHVTLQSDQVRDRLSKITDEAFVQEYMLIRNQAKLRRMFGLCFVAECVNRDLTTMLIEMTIDFIVLAKQNFDEDREIKVNVSEMTLLYLNNVDLSECITLLKCECEKGVLLCDYFMRTIALSQNFSRFKPVFVQLAGFMVREGRTFSLDVVEHILERVSIFPFERPLARAVVAMLGRTSAKVFENSMIRMFEKQILVDSEVMQGYWSAKCACAGRLESFSSSSSAVSSPRRGAAPEPEERTALAPSPDTTNLDTLSKKSEETIITRTIDVNRPRLPTLYPPRPPTENQRVIRNLFHWKRDSQGPMRAPLTPMRPTFPPPRPYRPMRGHPHKRPPERLVTYSHTNYKTRWPGPNY